MAKEFEIRICRSGSSGVAFYIPADIVKELNLKEEINTKLQATLDDDGDIVVYSSELAGEEND